MKHARLALFLAAVGALQLLEPLATHGALLVP